MKQSYTSSLLITCMVTSCMSGGGVSGESLKNNILGWTHIILMCKSVYLQWA